MRRLIFLTPDSMGNKGIIVILVPLDDGVGLIRMGDYGLLSPVSSLVQVLVSVSTAK